MTTVCVMCKELLVETNRVITQLCSSSYLLAFLRLTACCFAVYRKALISCTPPAEHQVPDIVNVLVLLVGFS